MRGTLVSSVYGNPFADVEDTPELILVSCRGMSKYNVYKRSLPHELVKQFAISPTKDGKNDSVAKNDGQGNVLEPDFPRG